MIQITRTQLHYLAIALLLFNGIVNFRYGLFAGILGLLFHAGLAWLTLEPGRRKAFYVITAVIGVIALSRLNFPGTLGAGLVVAAIALATDLNTVPISFLKGKGIGGKIETAPDETVTTATVPPALPTPSNADALADTQTQQDALAEKDRLEAEQRLLEQQTSGEDKYGKKPYPYGKEPLSDRDPEA